MKHAPEALTAFFGLLVAGSLGQDNDDLPSVVDDRYAVATLCMQRTMFYTCALLAPGLWLVGVSFFLAHAKRILVSVLYLT